METLLTSSLNWWFYSDSCGINLLRYAIMPKRHQKSCLDLWKGMTFSESGEILFLDILCPENISSVAPKTHLPFLFSNLTFEFCLRLAQSERLINLGLIPVWWYRLDHSLPLQTLYYFFNVLWENFTCTMYPIRCALKSKSI